MRVAVILSAFVGGAPQSILQYVKVLINHNHDIFVCGTKGSEQCAKDFSEIGAVVKEVTEGFASSSQLGKVQGIYSMILSALHWKPDCIIGVGLPVGFYLSGICDSYKIPFLSIIPGGDLSGGKSKIAQFKAKNTIVFSNENEKQLKEFGYQGDIHLISNRIKVEPINDIDVHYNTQNECQKKKIIIASRIDSKKIESIIATIDLVLHLKEQGVDVELDIAGSGELEDKVKLYISENDNYKCINYLGYCDDICYRYKESHICIGKGRSILEPLIMGRYVICASEERTFKIVDSHSFDSLMEYNFSGRNMIDSSSENEIMILAKNTAKVDNIEMLLGAQKKAIDQYSADALDKRFYIDLFERYYVGVTHRKTRTNRFMILLKIFHSWLVSR